MSQISRQKRAVIAHVNVHFAVFDLLEGKAAGHRILYLHPDICPILDHQLRNLCKQTHLSKVTIYDCHRPFVFGSAGTERQKKQTDNKYHQKSSWFSFPHKKLPPSFPKSRADSQIPWT